MRKNILLQIYYFYRYCKCKKAKNFSIFCNNNNVKTILTPRILFPLQQLGQNDEISTICLPGVFFEKDLNFKIHIKSIMTKFLKGIFALRTTKNI